MIPTKLKKLMTKKSLVVPVVAVALGAGVLIGCDRYVDYPSGRNADGVATSQGATTGEGREDAR